MRKVKQTETSHWQLFEGNILKALNRKDWEELRVLTLAMMKKFPRKATAHYYVDYVGSLVYLNRPKEALSHRAKAIGRTQDYLKDTLFYHFAVANVSLGNYRDAYSDFRKAALRQRDLGSQKSNTEIPEEPVTVVDMIRDWVEYDRPPLRTTSAFLRASIQAAEKKSWGQEHDGTRKIPAKKYLPGLRQLLAEAEAAPS